MLTMDIPDVEILTVRLFTVRFDVFARWHQRLWFKRWEFNKSNNSNSADIISNAP